MDEFIKTLDSKINNIEILISCEYVSKAQKKKLETKCTYLKKQKTMLAKIFASSEDEMLAL